eukprot:UN06796
MLLGDVMSEKVIVDLHVLMEFKIKMKQELIVVVYVILVKKSRSLLVLKQHVRNVFLMFVCGIFRTVIVIWVAEDLFISPSLKRIGHSLKINVQKMIIHTIIVTTTIITMKITSISK